MHPPISRSTAKKERCTSEYRTAHKRVQNGTQTHTLQRRHLCDSADTLLHFHGFCLRQFLTTVKNRVATPLRPFGGVTTALWRRHYGPLTTPLRPFDNAKRLLSFCQVVAIILSSGSYRFVKLKWRRFISAASSMLGHWFQSHTHGVGIEHHAVAVDKRSYLPAVGKGARRAADQCCGSRKGGGDAV